MTGVPVGLLTARDFISVRAELVRFLGSADDALVFTRIQFRSSSDSPYGVKPKPGDDWWATMTLDTLAEETGLSFDQVRRTLKRLLQAGHIQRAQLQAGGNRDRTFSYQIVPDYTPPAAPRISHVAESPDGENLHVADPPDGAISHVAESPDVHVAESPHVNPLKELKKDSLKRDADFDLDSQALEFYELWPRKVGKPTALLAFRAAVLGGRASAEEIIEAARAYRANPHQPPKEYIPHPTTWLHRDGWDDELPGPHIEHPAAPARPTHPSAPRPARPSRVAEASAALDELRGILARDQHPEITS